MKKLLNVLLVLTAVSAVAPAAVMYRDPNGRFVSRARYDARVQDADNADQAQTWLEWAYQNKLEIAAENVAIAGVGVLLTLATAYKLYNSQVDCAQEAANFCAGIEIAAPAAVEACKAYLPYVCRLGF